MILEVDLVVCENIDQTHPLAHPRASSEITYLLFFLLGSRYRHLAIVPLIFYWVDSEHKWIVPSADIFVTVLLPRPFPVW